MAQCSGFSKKDLMGIRSLARRGSSYAASPKLYRMLLSTHRIPGLVLSEHQFEVPLDYADPEAEQILVFARTVSRPRASGRSRPWLVFLQGGPGFGAPRPFDSSGWLGRALDEYDVVLLDERGTGLSTPQTARSLASLDAQHQAAKLALFRADSIVRDAELVRRELCGDERWTVLGQSYGGFCATRYLSAAPAGLAGVVLTGGLPPLHGGPDEVYRRTYPRVLERNRQYYARYPGDVDRGRRIAQILVESDVRLPCGDRLSVRRFQQLGLQLGMSDGAEALHYLFEQAFVVGEDELSQMFLREFENALHFDTNPIFAILHEACYTQGTASNWSAERLRGDFPEFAHDPDAPLFFTGEMIYPWMFEEIGALRPLREAAEILAAREDWPQLYDPEQLAGNEIPTVAAVYVNDMYVDRVLSEETAAAIRGTRIWMTNEFEHNGLRAAGARVLGQLLDMLHGRR